MKLTIYIDFDEEESKKMPADIPSVIEHTRKNLREHFYNNYGAVPDIYGEREIEDE